MEPDDAIAAMLEKHLTTMAGGLTLEQTQLPNTEFKPTGLVPYQRVWHVPAPVHDYGGSATRKRYAGFMQVDLCFPYGQGEGDVGAAAEAIRARFAKGLSLTANNVTTRVDRTPERKAGRQEGDRWVIAIRVYYFANV